MSASAILKSDYPFIVGLSMVKNEGDIIESFIRHNKDYINLFCILDNGSYDNTREILTKLQAEGFPIIILEDPEIAYLQSEKMTAFLEHTMQTLFPDFILLLDADEFIKCDSKEVFHEEINRIPKHGAGLICWQSYVYNDLSNKKNDNGVKLVYRKEFEGAANQKVIFRPEGDFVKDLVVWQGNHFIKGVEDQVNIDRIKLAHLPIRSPDQLKGKCLNGCAAYLMKSSGAKNNIQGYQWFEVFEKIKKGEELSNDFLIEFSENYSNTTNSANNRSLIKDPLNFNFTELKYSNPKKLDLISQTANLIDDLLSKDEDEFIKYFQEKLVEKRNKLDLNKNKLRKNEQIFDDSWHINNLYFDIPPFKYLSEKFNPDSVLDVGCGIGHYLNFFKHSGANKVLGIDGIDESYSILNENEYVSMDLDNDIQLGQSFDLVMCLETLEHLNYDAALRAVKSISAHANQRIVFSAAEPGQPGIGHINCQPIQFWIERFLELGWVVNTFESVSIRMLSTFPWFKRNLLVFERDSDRLHDNSSFIQTIGKKKFDWINTGPDIILYPFQNIINKDKESITSDELISVLFSDDHNNYQEFLQSFTFFKNDSSSWIVNSPIIYAIVNTLAPTTFVEIGSHYGTSYFTICQAIVSNQINCNAFAIDNWIGGNENSKNEKEAYEYFNNINNNYYSSFSHLMNFNHEEAAEYFNNDTIDLLHINGLKHSVESLKNIDIWLPRMSNNGVILLSYLNSKDSTFNTMDLYQVLSADFRNSQVSVGNGLGIIITGKNVKGRFKDLVSILNSDNNINNVFESLGDKLNAEVVLDQSIKTLSIEKDKNKSRITDLSTDIKRLKNIIHDKNKAYNEVFEKLKNLHKSGSHKQMGSWISYPVKQLSRHLFFNKRKSIVEKSGMFDENYYLLNNPDVKIMGISPIRHFIDYGGNEGRSPSEFFDSKYYLKNNIDVLLSGINPLVHFLLFGRPEGRKPLPDK